MVDPEVATSLASPRVRLFDLVFMMSLSSTQCRVFFRLLDTYWYSELETSKKGYLDFTVVELGRLLRMTNLRPDSIQRIVDPMHQELIDAGFLISAEVKGRGIKRQIRYIVNPQRPDYPMSPEQLELVGRVKRMDVPDIQARDYVRKHATTHVRAKIILAERILAQTTTFRRSKSAYAWDILTDQRGKYTPKSAERDEKASTTQPAVSRPTISDDAIHRVFESQLRVNEDLTPAEQWTTHAKALRFFLKNELTKAENEALADHCRTGGLSASQLSKDLSTHHLTSQASVFIDRLKTQLADLNGGPIDPD